MKNKFGFDEAFNYKEEHDLNATLKRSVFATVCHTCGTNLTCHHKLLKLTFFYVIYIYIYIF